MKKLLPGLIGALVAVIIISCTAWVDSPKAILSALKPNTEPCGEVSKRWWLINIDCASQVQVGDIRNPANYRYVNNYDSVWLHCAGSTCVCAIWACPAPFPNWDKPNISSTTAIYTDLYNYFHFGLTYSDIMIKDEQE